MSEQFPIPVASRGVVREASVDEMLSPADSIEFSLNGHFDRIGAWVRRKGTTRLGDGRLVNLTPIRGMGNYRNNAGTIYAALAKVGTVVKAYTGSSWADVRTGLTASSKARFTNLVDHTFMVNGNGNESCATWNGSGNFGSTNVASLPAGDYIENYRNRIWILDKSTDKLYYSNVVTTSNTITGGTEFIQISPADGESGTGIKRTANALLVFKQNHIYRVFSINSVDPDPYINVGTYSQESIVEAKDGVYFHHSTGFYRYTAGGTPEEISRPIIDVIQAIPRSSYEDITGWADYDHVSWAIGNITLNGVSLTSVTCRYTISTQTWTLYSDPSQFLSGTLYDNGTTIVQLLGDEFGSVVQYDTGNDFFEDSPVHYEYFTHPLYFSQNKGVKKSMSQVAGLHENAHSSNISYQLDSDNQKNNNNAWKEAGAIDEDIYSLASVDAQNFSRIRLRLSGNSPGSPFIFRGFEVVDLSVHGITKPQ